MKNINKAKKITNILYYISCTLLIFHTTAYASVPLQVPAGNRMQQQPAIPSASHTRTKALKSSYDKKFAHVLNMLQRDRGLLKQIKSIAQLYEIDPVHILGAIVGEHTYNYDALDSAQSYYMKALQYARIPISFQYNGEKIWQFIQRPEFGKCNTAETSNSRWRCYELVWNKSFMDRTKNGKTYPNQRFHRVFFRPMFAGQSFGLGQITPLTALKMNDLVNEISGLPKLDPKNAGKIYRTVMDPTMSLHYTAAVLKDSIEAYRKVANTDISTNPGVTSTLYNLGNPWERAAIYKRKRQSRPAVLPVENYYGWFVNHRLEELRALLN